MANTQLINSALCSALTRREALPILKQLKLTADDPIDFFLHYNLLYAYSAIVETHFFIHIQALHTWMVSMEKNSFYSESPDFASNILPQLNQLLYEAGYLCAILTGEEEYLPEDDDEIHLAIKNMYVRPYYLQYLREYQRRHAVLEYDEFTFTLQINKQQLLAQEQRMISRVKTLKKSKDKSEKDKQIYIHAQQLKNCYENVLDDTNTYTSIYTLHHSLKMMVSKAKDDGGWNPKGVKSFGRDLHLDKYALEHIRNAVLTDGTVVEMPVDETKQIELVKFHHR
jgi:hypothetical protein